MHVIRSATLGGVESHVQMLCRYLKQRGAEVILTSLVNVEPHSTFLGLGVDLIRLHDRMEWSWAVASSVWGLRKILVERRPDVVHLHGIRPMLVGTLAARLACNPAIVSSLHGAYTLMALDPNGAINQKRLVLAKLCHAMAFLLSARLILVCDSLKSEVRSVLAGVIGDANGFIERKVRIVHNGIDIPSTSGLETTRDLRKRLGIDLNTVIVGTVSRLEEPKKGIGILLKAVAQLRTQNLDIHLVIAGDGYSRSFLERQADTLGLQSDTHFLGFVEQPASLYASLDIFVLPSCSEGFPLVNLEAMASGIPVVTTNVGGTAEAVLDGVNGFVVPPNDVEALSAALERLYRSGSLRRKMGQEGRRIFESWFSARTMVDKIVKVYDEVLG